MQFTVAVLALAGSVVASNIQERAASVDPASASLALFGALPTSLAQIAITNPAAAATIIQGEFATGTPTWFGKLPGDVQTYFLTAAAAAVPTTTPIGTGTGSTTNSTATGKYNNGTTSAATSTSGTTKLSTSTVATTAASSAKASSSTGGAASVPTGIVGAGIAGAAGLLAMLAL